MANILIVDDEKDIRELLGDILEDEGNVATKVGHAQDAIDKVDQSAFDLVILDIWLKESHMDGIDILKYIKNRHPDLPVVIISGHGNVEIAVAAIKQGAFDFIEKPFNVDQLLVVVNRALELSHLRRAKRKLDVEGASNIEIIGNSSAIRNLRGLLEKLSKTHTRVMFIGQSGSGKELAARYLHAHSPRAKEAFICVNSAMISADDMERQLFGYEEKGKIYQGLFERANGGTLFFDEIADMPLATQGKILRVINDQRFERIGGSQSISADARILSASKEDIPQKIKEGKFREELYHRLAIAPVDVPPLAHHIDDMAELVTHFVEILSRRENLPVRVFSINAIEALQTIQWSGNVRELRNKIERILILFDGTGEIGAEHINKLDAKTETGVLGSEYLFLPLREARELFEQRYLMAQINRFSGNISKTANFIGMERSALHRKMKSLQIGSQDE